MSTETTTSSPCACGARPGDGTHAVGVDPEAKHAIVSRLRRIEGQVRGLQKMVEEERYCADVLMQLSSVQEALRGVGRALLSQSPEALRHRGDPLSRSGQGGSDVRGVDGADV